ncbi:MAG TPA: hypothetical protein VHI13_06885 [Candidatus Kapabacteria bacterium]|nr:hypothetical protein [Candidatus Kapabacteria bacterium]
MNEKIPADHGGEEREQRRLDRAGRFAYDVMVNLAVAGFVLALLVIRSTPMALGLGGICIAGMFAREIALLRGATSTQTAGSSFTRRRSWPGIAVRAGLMAAIWLLQDYTEGRLTLRSMAFAAAIGACTIAYFWWSEAHSRAGKRDTPNAA